MPSHRQLFKIIPILLLNILLPKITRAQQPAQLYQVTPDSLQRAIQNNPILLVDYQASWCGPCRKMDPILTDLQTNHQIPVLRIDIDYNKPLAQANAVWEIPTLLLYVKGQQKNRIEGYTPKKTLLELIQQAQQPN